MLSVLIDVNTLKSLLLLMLALLVAVNSYSNYQTLARTQVVRPAVPARTAYIAASYEPVMAHPDSKSLTRELMHGLRVNFSLAIFLVFVVAASLNEKPK